MKKSSDTSETGRSVGFEALIRRISEGSDEAVWMLLDRYSSNILRVVRRHLPSELRTKVDSVDIVQSVWKSLLRKGEAFDHIQRVEHFVAFIAACARNKVLETHRNFTQYERANIRREVTLAYEGDRNASSSPSPPDLVDRRTTDPCDNAAAREKWNLALKQSGDRGQRVLQLRLQGMTLDEIAEETGMSKITVRRDIDAILASLTA